MANVYYGVDKGGSVQTDVTRSTSTTSKAFEVVVDDAWTLLEQIEAAQAYLQYLISRTQP